MSVSQCGVGRKEYMDAVEEMAEKAIADACTATNPRVPEKEDVISILKDMYE